VHTCSENRRNYGQIDAQLFRHISASVVEANHLDIMCYANINHCAPTEQANKHRDMSFERKTQNAQKHKRLDSAANTECFQNGTAHSIGNSMGYRLLPSVSDNAENSPNKTQVVKMAVLAGSRTRLSLQNNNQ
jgi:hypothetical protein